MAGILKDREAESPNSTCPEGTSSKRSTEPADYCPLGRYTYNHRGERIAKLAGTKASRYLYEAGNLSAELDANGKLTRQYLYLASQPIAVIDTPLGKATDRGERDALEQAMHDLGTIVHAWFSDDERIVWLHANHLGAIEVGEPSR